jgi:hypothetical protein
MPNPQLMPAGARSIVRRRSGLGDVTQTPEYQAALKQLTNQLTEEGQSQLDIQTALGNFGTTFQQITQGGMSAEDGLKAALQYTLGAHSYGAAVDMVTGLVGAITSGAPPAALLTTFTGTMVGVMVLAGAISAGVGAAIVGVASIVIGLLQQLGLFGGAPQGQSLPGCPGTTFTGKGPDYQLPLPSAQGQSASAVYAWPDPYWQGNGNKPVAPGSPFWRRFPVATLTGGIWQLFGGGPDNWWFTSAVPSQGYSAFTWPQSMQWLPANNNKSLSLYFCYPGWGSYWAYGFRFIDAAFPLYHQMECETSIGESMFITIVPPQGGVPDTTSIAALVNFNAAFFTALKLNWEYALNGVKPPATDLQVLVHTIYTWNRAHAPGTGLDIQPDNSSQPWSPNGTTCAGVPPWYAAILSSNAGTQSWPDGVLSADGTKFHINTGPAKPFSLAAKGIVLGHGGVIGLLGGGTTQQKQGSTLGNIAIGTATAVGVTAGGLAVYAYATKQSYTGVLSSLWGTTKSGARAGVSKVKGVFRR